MEPCMLVYMSLVFFILSRLLNWRQLCEAVLFPWHFISQFKVKYFHITNVINRKLSPKIHNIFLHTAAYRFGCVMLTKLWCHMHAQAHTFLVNPNQLYLLNFISMLIYAHSIGWAFSLVSLSHTFSHFWTRSASAALYSVALIMISTWFTWFAQMKFIFIEANFVYFTFSAWDFSLISHH